MLKVIKNKTPEQNLLSPICAEYGKFKCVDCAEHLEKKLTGSGWNIKYLKLDAIGPKNGRPLVLCAELYDDFAGMYANWVDSVDTVIADTSLHYGVEVNGIVFDNVFPNGIERADWERIFKSHYPLEVIAIPSIVNRED